MMTSNLTKAAVTAVTLLLSVGCGSSVTNENEASAGTESGSGGTTGSSGSTGTGGACAAYADQQGSASVTVRFRNETGMPVYLPASCAAVRYDIVPTAGDDGVSYQYDGSCLQTCEHRQTSPQMTCGACAQLAYRIEPGATKDVTWDGTGLKGGVAMPGECFYPMSPTNACGQIVAAQSGNYRVEVTGFSECGPGCTCDDKGECVGDATGLQAFADPVKFDFPAAGTVEVLFGVCAFGCAGGDL